MRAVGRWVVGTTTGLVVLIASAGAAQAAAPVIVNNVGNGTNGVASWIEGQAGTDDAGNRRVTATFVVRHDANSRITGVAVDNNWDGTDNTPSVSPTGVTAEYLGTTGSSSGTNRLASSIVRFSFDPGRPGDFSCPAFSDGTRRVDKPIRFRVVDSSGQRSGTVAENFHWVENDGCTNTTGTDDYAVLESVSQSATTASPGQTVNFTFTCDDADSTGTNDRCDYIMWHWRRLNDGATSGATNNDAEDNTTRTFGVSFPSRGIYVVEAYLCGEDSCEDSTLFRWRLGTVIVDDNGSPTGSLNFSGPGVVQGSPDSVNQGVAADAVASVSDPNGGVVQVIGWDADNNGSYERTDYTTPQLASNALSWSNLSTSNLTQSVDTSTFGLKTINAEIYDNGVADASGNDRNRTTMSAQLRVNAVPTAQDTSATTNEDTPKDVTLLGADADNQPAALSYHVVAQPAHGTVTITGNQAHYTPAANFNGTDSFTYNAADGPVVNQAWGTSPTKTVTVTVNAVNDPPSAQDQMVTTNEDTALTGITLGATDVDGDSLTYTATQPAHGAVSCSGSTCTYTPAANYNGTDSFAFTADDGHGGTGTGHVDVIVTPVQDPPAWGASSVTTDEDTATPALGATDVDGDTLSYAVVDQAAHGTVTCTAAGCVYTPAPDSNGTDAFTISASDGNATVPQHFDVTVNPVEDAPSAADQTLFTDEDTPLAISLTATDPDSDTLTYAVAGQPAHGDVSCAGSDCTYTPDADFNGDDHFTFTVDDGNGGTDAGRVDITVNPVNDPPVADDATATTDEDTPVTTTLSAHDADGDTLSASVTSAPAHGGATCTGLSCSYTPDADFNGSDSYGVTVSDGNGGTDTATVAVTVTPVNDAPVAGDDSQATDEDTPVAFQLAATDVDHDTLSFSVTSGPGSGHVSCDGSGACTYTPDANFNGADAFDFTVSDGNGGTDTGHVDITVRPVNDPPVVQDVSPTTDEDTPRTFPVPAMDVDVDPLSTSATTQPQHGSATCSGLSCTYTPAPDYNGTDAFTYTVSDGQGGSDTATAHITVTPVNDAPVALDLDVATDEDTPLALDLVANDVDGDALTYSASQPAHGHITCPGGDEHCVYSPAGNYNGPDAFTYTVSDGNGGTDTATVSITVRPVNDPPTASDTTLTIPEDSSVSFQLTYSDVDGDALNLVADDPAHGAVSCSASGFCTYTPAANYNGTDTFGYTVSDGNGGSDSAVVTVTVTPVNDDPVAQNAAITTDEDTAKDFTVDATDVDGDTLGASVSDAPLHGQAVCDGPSNCRYTPDQDFNGSDVFQVTVTDGNGGSDTATIHVTVSPVNDAPVAQDASATIPEDSSVSLQLQATDVDHDTLAYSVTDQPAHGTASCSGTGFCTYTPAANFNGTDAFAITVDDGHGGTDTGRVDITVTPVNDAPTLSGASITTDEDTPGSADLSASDVDGDTLSYAVTDAPSHGSASCDASGHCTYTPAANSNGTDVFAVTVSDGNGGTASALVHVTVNAVNDAPVAHDGTATTDEDHAVGVGIDASDVDGDALSASVTSAPAHGTATCSGLTCTYTPAPDYNGTDAFGVTVSDGHGGTATATIAVTVNPVNDAPIASDTTATTPEDTAVGVTVVASDVDGDPLTITAGAQPSHGTASCEAGTCTYTPAPNYNGGDAFTFVANDGHGATATGHVTITVTPVNDAPHANAQAVQATEDTPKQITLSGTDVDGDSLAYSATEPAHGTLSCSGASCTYTPAANYNGPDAFSFTANDGHGGTDTATVTIAVAAVDDAPTAQDVSVTTDEDTPANFALLGNDVDDTLLTYTIVSGPSHGSLTCTGAMCHYTPAADYHGSDAVTYKVTDPSGLSATGHVAITVTSVSDPTQLSVPPVIRLSGFPLKLTVMFQATLTRTNGAPLAGKTVTWVVGGQRVCSAKTNDQGFAACGWSVGSLLGVVLGNGYTAVFDGDEDYNASSGSGKLLG